MARRLDSSNSDQPRMIFNGNKYEDGHERETWTIYDAQGLQSAVDSRGAYTFSKEEHLPFNSLGACISSADDSRTEAIVLRFALVTLQARESELLNLNRKVALPFVLLKKYEKRKGTYC